MAGLPRNQLCPALNFELMALWQKLGGGWARVVRYRNELDGAGYITKNLGFASLAEQDYEMRKFGGTHCHLILSDSVWRALRQARLDGLRMTYGRRGVREQRGHSGTTLGKRSVVTLKAGPSRPARQRGAAGLLEEQVCTETNLRSCAWSIWVCVAK